MLICTISFLSTESSLRTFGRYRVGIEKRLIKNKYYPNLLKRRFFYNMSNKDGKIPGFWEILGHQTVYEGRDTIQVPTIGVRQGNGAIEIDPDHGPGRYSVRRYIENLITTAIQDKHPRNPRKPR